MKRLFAFGCSYTKYFYPTWADILIANFDHGWNCGHIGSSNQLSANRIWETFIKTDLTEDDIIVINWTNYFREDRYHTKTGWHTPGNVFNNLSQKSFTLNNYNYNTDVDWADLEHFLYRDCNIITSTLQGLEHTKAKVISTCINNPYTDTLLLEQEKLRNLMKSYKKYLTPQVKTISEHCYYPGIEQDKTRLQYNNNGNWIIEDHPLPKEHLSYATEVLGPELKINISHNTSDWIYEADKKLRSTENLQYDSVFDGSTSKTKWII